MSKVTMVSTKNPRASVWFYMALFSNLSTPIERFQANRSALSGQACVQKVWMQKIAPKHNHILESENALGLALLSSPQKQSSWIL